MAYGVRWLISDYSQTWLDGTCQVEFTTDRAVHAWLRWTVNPPNMHLLSLTQRGLNKMADPYFCFTVYQDIEQEEAGDTFTHTFLWPGWYHCLTRYFLFWATAGGEKTPTQWGIFSKHYTDLEIHTLLPVANTVDINIPFPDPNTWHYLMCQSQDTNWVPPPGGGIYGHFVGNYVWNRVYNGPTTPGDRYEYPGLPPTVTDIRQVAIIGLFGKVYVYGKYQLLLKTHGTSYYTPVTAIGGPGLVEYSWPHPVNPSTLAKWTVAEVNALEAGIRLQHQGTFGMAICDQVRIEVTHRPVA